MSWWKTHTKRGPGGLPPGRQLSNKGEALEKFCEHLGIGLEQVTVFGDAHNDLSMFALRCRKVAVDCAVPEIKALADIVLGPEDSVLKFIGRELKA